MEKGDQLVVFGDIHKKWQRVQAIMAAEPSIGGIYLSTGDLCNYKFDNNQNKRIVFCPGNHENYYAIDDIRKDEKNLLRPLSAGERYILPNGVTVASLPGVFSPNFYDSNDKKGVSKYYSREDVEITKSLGSVDLLITHEAPREIGLIKNGQDLGREHINEVIDSLRPKICFFGHHHKLHETQYNGIPVFGLDMPHRSYAVLDLDNYDVRIEKAQLGKRSYEYQWESQNGKN